MLQVGDLVYDRSTCQYGIILEEKKWHLIGQEDAELEYTILYPGGEIDTAYEQELWHEKEMQ
tara:strand:+ start:60 stop:245 length:186 start_codon:yes stop_codon:yes gene_type:complete